MGRRGRSNLTDEQFFFVTTTVVKFLPIFSDEINCNILINNIKFYQSKHLFDILGYVIMPSHFHWIIKTDPKGGTVSDIMRDIKKFTAWQILDRVDNNELQEWSVVFKNEAANYKDQQRKFWIKRFDDEVIRNEKMFWVKLHYIHNNPVKAGIVNEITKYKYSSARNYVYNDHSVLNVDTDYAGTEII